MKPVIRSWKEEIKKEGRKEYIVKERELTN
jgi:hypothetical protein